MMMDKAAKLDFMCVGDHKEIVKHCQSLVKNFEFTAKFVNNIDLLLDDTESNPTFVLLLSTEVEGMEIANQVQVVRQVFPEAYILAVVGRRVSPENAAFIKKSGASYVIMELEAIGSSKLEFISNQAIRASYVPVKTSELMEETKIPFSVFHLMPLNKKYLIAVRPDEILSSKKKQKLSEVSEVYCRREDAALYAKYVEQNTDRSAKGLQARCRAQFLALTAGFVDLALLITDQSERSSFDAGKKLFDRCLVSAQEMNTNLGVVGEPWDVITNSAIGSFGTVERAPAVAAYAGLLSLLAGVGKPEIVTLCGLLCDIGMLDLNSSIITKLQQKQPLTEEELKEYNQHPNISLTRCGASRLPLDEKMRNIILATHERIDGKGPRGLISDKIPPESQLIQLCQMIDEATAIRWGEARKNPREVQQAIYEREFKSNVLSPSVLHKVKPFLVA